MGKQHVTIVPVPGAPVAKVLPKTTAAPAKAPVSQENKKPESSTPATSKGPEAAKSPTTESGPALALREIGQQAAQKAKEGKKGRRDFQWCWTGRSTKRVQGIEGARSREGGRKGQTSLYRRTREGGDSYEHTHCRELRVSSIAHFHSLERNR